MSLKNGVLEGCLFDFGSPGGRFWRPRAQFFHDFRMLLAECAENLPRTCRGLAQLVDAYLRSLRFCGLAPLGRDLLRGGGPAVIPPRGFQLHSPHPGFEKFWEDLGKVLEAFSQAFLCQDPRAVSRSPAERLNTRGFRPQTRVRSGLTSGLILLSLLEWVFVSYTLGFTLLTE